MALKPEHALKRANDLINSAVGTNGEKEKRMARDMLHAVISVKKKGIWNKTYEQVMRRHLELDVDLKDHMYAKDGLHQYRNLCLADPVTLENVVLYLLELSEDRAMRARQKADRVALADAARVGDLEQAESPESIMLSSMTEEGAKERTDRELVVPWLRFLWENFRSTLDLLYRLPKLERVYHKACEKAFKFCVDYNRTMEFKRLCEMLRTQLQHLQKAPVGGKGSRTQFEWTPDAVEAHLQTRFAQLEVATSMQLWNEAFRTVEDINTIMLINKKAPRTKLLVTYYEKLSHIFWVADNKLFHAYAVLQLYLASVEFKSLKSEERSQLAGNALVAALAVPSIKDIYAAVSIEEEDVPVDRSSSLAKLLDFQANPSRQNLLHEIVNRGVLDYVSTELRSLYDNMEVNFKPLSMVSNITKAVEAVNNDSALSVYTTQLEKIIVVKVLQQLSRVYSTVRIDFVYKLLSGLKQLSTVQFEKIILDAIAHKQLQLKISHANGTITFSNTSSATAAVETQAAQLGSVLNKVARSITASKVTAKLESDKVAARKAFLQKVAENLDNEFDNYADRKMIIENRKEDLEKVQADNTKKILDLVRMDDEKRKADEIARLANEQKEREQVAERAKLDQLEVLRVQQELTQKYKITKTEAELTSLTSAQRFQLITDAKEELQKQKDEENRRMQDALKKLDHITRAIRIEEAAAVRGKSDNFASVDDEYLAKKSEDFAAAFKEKHVASLVEKARLAKMQAFRESFENNVILQKQRQDYEKMLLNARRKAIIDQREKRLADARDKYQAVQDKLEEERQREIEREAAEERERIEREQHEASRRAREREEAEEREREARLAAMAKQVEEAEARKREAAAAAAKEQPTAAAAPSNKYVPPSARSAEPAPSSNRNEGGESWRRVEPRANSGFGNGKQENDGGWRKTGGNDRDFGRGGDRDSRGGFGGRDNRDRDNRGERDGGGRDNRDRDNRGERDGGGRDNNRRDNNRSGGGDNGGSWRRNG